MAIPLHICIHGNAAITLFFTIVSNSLIQLWVASIFYMVWFRQRSILIPYLQSLNVIVVALAFKVAIATDMPIDALACNCYVKSVYSTSYGMASIHVALAVMLAMFYGRRLVPSSLTTSTVIIDSLAAPMSMSMSTEAYIRLALIIIYVALVVAARIYLMMNSIIDVVVGAVIGIIFGLLEYRITPLLEAKILKHE